MKSFVIRRLLSLVPLLLVVTFITQSLLVAAPGDYLTTVMESKRLSDATI